MFCTGTKVFNLPGKVKKACTTPGTNIISLLTPADFIFSWYTKIIDKKNKKIMNQIPMFSPVFIKPKLHEWQPCVFMFLLISSLVGIATLQGIEIDQN